MLNRNVKFFGRNPDIMPNPGHLVILLVNNLICDFNDKTTCKWYYKPKEVVRTSIEIWLPIDFDEI